MKRIMKWPLLLIAIPWALILLLVQTVQGRGGMRGGDPAIGSAHLRPATGPLVAMPQATTDAVIKAVATPHFTEPLATLSKDYAVAARTLSVRLEAASDGSIFNCEIQDAKDLPAAFQTALRSKILSWRFGFLSSPSFCTVELRVGPPPQTAPATTQAAPAPAEIADLIRKLGAAAFADREGAQALLLEIGAPALSALAEAKRAADPEVVSRAETISDAIQFTGAPTTGQLESGQIAVGDVPYLGLEHFLQLQNRRQGAAVAPNGWETPEGALMSKWMQAAESELRYRGYTSVDGDHMRRPDGTVVQMR